MNKLISTSDLAIWIVLIAGRLFLCLSIVRKGLHRKMPWFSLYAVSSTLESIVLLGIAFFFSYSVYYYVFYATSHLVSLTAFLTLIECGRRVLPGLDLPQREKAVFFLLVAISAIVAFVCF
jgi:magnesium-transporting ATPase (P-type)